MTDEQARTTANVLLASAGAAAAYVIITTPSLRRLALRAAQLWLGASIPVYVLGQVRQAWVQSARS